MVDVMAVEIDGNGNGGGDAVGGSGVSGEAWGWRE